MPGFKQVVSRIIQGVERQAINSVPDASKINFFIQKKGGVPTNDHMAFRTISKVAHPNAVYGGGFAPLAALFMKMGFRSAGKLYRLPDAVDAIHLEPPAIPGLHLPKIFMSQQNIWRLPRHVEELIAMEARVKPEILEVWKELNRDYLTTNRFIDERFGSLALQLLSPIFTVTEISSLAEINKHSQYAAWTLLHGNHVNHITLRVDQLHPDPNNPLNDIDALVEALKSEGVVMKEGGIVGPSFLRQTATAAESRLVKIRNDHGDVEWIPWPKCYYELIQRGKMENGKIFQGFLESNTPDLLRNTSLPKTWQKRLEDAYQENSVTR